MYERTAWFKGGLLILGGIFSKGLQLTFSAVTMDYYKHLKSMNFLN